MKLDILPDPVVVILHRKMIRICQDQFVGARPLAPAFGFALGLTFLLFYFILHARAATFINGLQLTPWLSFIYGFIAGTVIAVLYNILVAHRLNLFGLDHYTD